MRYARSAGSRPAVRHRGSAANSRARRRPRLCPPPCPPRSKIAPFLPTRPNNASVTAPLSRLVKSWLFAVFPTVVIEARHALGVRWSQVQILSPRPELGGGLRPLPTLRGRGRSIRPLVIFARAAFLAVRTAVFARHLRASQSAPLAVRSACVASWGREGGIGFFWRWQ